jgi:hypothetical protein
MDVLLEHDRFPEAFFAQLAANGMEYCPLANSFLAPRRANR